MSLLDKLKKNSKIEGADILSESNLYSKKDVCQTSVPMINVALSGSIDGGLTWIEIDNKFANTRY